MKYLQLKKVTLNIREIVVLAIQKRAIKLCMRNSDAQHIINYKTKAEALEDYELIVKHLDIINLGQYEKTIE